MKKNFLLVIMLIIPFYVFSQDLIIRKNGKKIDCEIIKIDSLNIYFSLTKDGNKVNSYINKSEVNSYKHNDYMQNKAIDPDFMHNAVTIGILEGGGSLMGADFETLVSKQIGLQIGAGLVGFGVGLDLHFMPSIRSSFLSLQYWHQGIGNSFTQSLIGPSFVYRGSKWFTFQLGVGFPLEKGPAYPENTQQPSIMLTYAIGAYIPY